MDNLKQALDSYIEANEGLRKAVEVLDALNVNPPDVSKQIHACACENDVWKKIVDLCDEKSVIVSRGCCDYPYKEEVMYGEYKIFRLLAAGKENELPATTVES